MTILILIISGTQKFKHPSIFIQAFALFPVHLNQSINQSITVGFNRKHDEDIYALTFKQSARSSCMF